MNKNHASNQSSFISAVIRFGSKSSLRRFATGVVLSWVASASLVSCGTEDYIGLCDERDGEICESLDPAKYSLVAIDGSEIAPSQTRPLTFRIEAGTAYSLRAIYPGEGEKVSEPAQAREVSGKSTPFGYTTFESASLGAIDFDSGTLDSADMISDFDTRTEGAKFLAEVLLDPRQPGRRGEFFLEQIYTSKLFEGQKIEGKRDVTIRRKIVLETVPGVNNTPSIPVSFQFKTEGATVQTLLSVTRSGGGLPEVNALVDSGSTAGIFGELFPSAVFLRGQSIEYSFTVDPPGRFLSRAAPFSFAVLGTGPGGSSYVEYLGETYGTTCFSNVGFPSQEIICRVDGTRTDRDGVSGVNILIKLPFVY